MRRYSILGTEGRGACRCWPELGGGDDVLEEGDEGCGP
jgi:hypothetical protein